MILRKKNLLRAAMVALSIAFGAPAMAGVHEVRVVATGIDHSSSKASAIALDYAKKRAMYLTAIKLQVEDAAEKIEAFDDKEVRAIIRGATVLRQRREGDVTYADISVTLVDEALRRALEIKDPPEPVDGEKNDHAVLLLPVYVGRDRPYVWENENLLRGPLVSQVLRQARGAVLVPAGDFDDLRLIDYQNALQVTAEELKPMFARYGASEIIIAVMTPGARNSAEPSSVLLRRLTEQGVVLEEFGVPPLRAKENDAERAENVAVAIAGTVTKIANATSQNELKKIADAKHVAIIFNYANSRELAMMQKTVRSIDGVLQLAIPSISLQQNDLSATLSFTLSKKALKKAINKAGILVTDRDGGWQLSLR